LTVEIQGNRSGTGKIGEGPVARLFKENLDGLRYESTRLEMDISELQHKADDLQNEITKAEETGRQSTLDQNQIWVLVSAIVTRLGSVVLLLFLVKILVPLYRYNIKLASYYDARADALELMNIQGFGGGADTMFEKLSTVLTPETIDFGNPPSSPAEQAIELAKYVLESQRNK
jgi:hypothetical protein